MRAVTWQGNEKMSVETVPDPSLRAPTDAIIRVTSTAICGSDLHLYSVLGTFMERGDIVGHEAMGIVEEVGSGVRKLKRGDRVVIPFVVACGECWMCRRGLQSQCETTQVHAHDTGATLFGYSKLYGQLAGGQAQYLRVPLADAGAIVVPDDGRPDERYLFMSDVLPTAWQAVDYAGVEAGSTVVVLGLGPIGQMSARIAKYRGARTVLAIDLVPERLALAERHGIETLNRADVADLADVVRDRIDGRGPDAVIDAVGMEAHGNPIVGAVHKVTSWLPDAVAEPMLLKAGVDRLRALHDAIGIVRRGGTISISGVYGGMADPMPMLQIFDKQLTIRAGQANVHRWISDIHPVVADPGDPLGVLDLASHRLSLDDAPMAYEKFQKKQDGFIKVVLDPWQAPPASSGASERAAEFARPVQ
ncbi:zinc-dependent alcohol dehydrogenase [Ruicaihuangia caeni]|uniref:Zinc-dependent alcohol dehydrogenase n=1 Tax=Ruicaihuangia caeni TaxID=3042517 RepID=A0AAW6TA43_9MICO|nr:zinc-dependent alcohol dehydrogenase [Klugiella sp. YN-L-19]MDI2099193.1 zinc-dependent alcohol dehydrogenase [Klugiella sp. YN-L-19]